MPAGTWTCAVRRCTACTPSFVRHALFGGVCRRHVAWWQHGRGIRRGRDVREKRRKRARGRRGRSMSPAPKRACLHVGTGPLAVQRKPTRWRRQDEPLERLCLARTRIDSSSGAAIFGAECKRGSASMAWRCVGDQRRPSAVRAGSVGRVASANGTER